MISILAIGSIAYTATGSKTNESSPFAQNDMVFSHDATVVSNTNIRVPYRFQNLKDKVSVEDLGNGAKWFHIQDPKVEECTFATGVNAGMVDEMNGDFPQGTAELLQRVIYNENARRSTNSGSETDTESQSNNNTQSQTTTGTNDQTINQENSDGDNTVVVTDTENNERPNQSTNTSKPAPEENNEIESGSDEVVTAEAGNSKDVPVQSRLLEAEDNEL